MIAAAEEQVYIFACPGFKQYCFFVAAKKRVIIENLKVKCVAILGRAVFFGHGHLLRAECG